MDESAVCYAVLLDGRANDYPAATYTDFPSGTPM